jgi:hypothetical protein
MKMWLWLPIVLCSIIVLLVHKNVARTLIKPALVIGIFAGAARLWFALENGDGSPVLVFFEYVSLTWLAALAGLSLCEHIQTPGIVSKRSVSKQLIYTVVFCLLVVAVNGMMLVQTAKAGSLPQWLLDIRSISHLTAIALQAGLVEETIFRLLFLPFIIWLLLLLRRETKPTKLTEFLAVLMAAAIFGSIHGQGFAGAMIFGVAFGYFFVQFGWYPCVIVHFVGNFFPFLVALKIHGS